MVYAATSRPVTASPPFPVEYIEEMIRLWTVMEARRLDNLFNLDVSTWISKANTWHIAGYIACS